MISDRDFAKMKQEVIDAGRKQEERKAKVKKGKDDIARKKSEIQREAAQRKAELDKMLADVAALETEIRSADAIMTANDRKLEEMRKELAKFVSDKDKKGDKKSGGYQW